MAAWTSDHDLAIPDINIDRAQLPARARPCDTFAAFNFIDRPVRRAEDLAAVTGEKPVGIPVERVARMHTEVLVRVHRIALSHHKSSEGPRTRADTKLLATRIVQLVEPANQHFRR
ncbi:protein of unknown function [uncultured Woeseiaceae bacterium]|uniref:Uncharacterized protein n=1 Tax=uncultured Woeseiaceae bacterium TaxID=1983305 RepID=A0A7D9H350_9GAMM|nr:protein of unknown function [uncultured Woeseiaceae bacterium]